MTRAPYAPYLAIGVDIMAAGEADMARKADTRSSHGKPGTVKLTVNVDPKLKQSAKVYAVVNGWGDLTEFLHDSLRHSMRSRLKKELK